MGFMKAAVVIPPVRDFYFTRHRFSGLGAKSLHKVLEKEGVQTGYINLPLVKEKGKTIKLPDALLYLRDFIIPGEAGGISFFTRYQHFGPGFTESACLIYSLDPDIVFFSCFAFCYAHQVLRLAEEVKKIAPSLPIVAGGAGVSVYPEYYLDNTDIDMVLTGDAGTSIPLFLKAFDKKEIPFSKVPHFYWKEKGRILKSGVMKKAKREDLSFALDITIETKKKIYISASFTKGCRKKCRFCTHWADDEMLTIPLPKVLEGIQEIKQQAGEKGKEIFIIYEDDNLLLEPEYFLALISLFKKELDSPSFFVETGIDYTLLTPSLLTTLINSGLKRVNFSLGSLHPSLCESEKRELNLSLYETLLSHIQKAGIPSITYFICGLKEDTKETTAQTLAYIAQKPALSGISLFYPVPGLPDFQDPGLFRTHAPCLCAGSSAYPWNQSLETRTLVTAFRLSRYINLLKRVQVSPLEKELLDTIRKTGRLHTLVKEEKTTRIITVPGTDQELERIFFREMNTRRKFL
jgi:anaerobic magnesium-protoporphyrin IX monomethyl ester cyclase